MEERTYKTMQRVGIANITIGIITITVGLSVGIIALVGGARLLKRKQDLTF